LVDHELVPKAGLNAPGQGRTSPAIG